MKEELAKKLAQSDTKENPLYSDYVENLIVYLHKEDIENICHPGPNDDDVEAALSQEEIATQFDEYSTEQMRQAVDEYIADENECKDKTRDELISYMVWLAAWDLIDDENSEYNEDMKKTA